jgi:hypothetical protein
MGNFLLKILCPAFLPPLALQTKQKTGPPKKSTALIQIPIHEKTAQQNRITVSCPVLFA